MAHSAVVSPWSGVTWAWMASAAQSRMEDLASVTVKSVADDAGTAGETGVLQVAEEDVDGRCP